MEFNATSSTSTEESFVWNSVLRTYDTSPIDKKEMETMTRTLLNLIWLRIPRDPLGVINLPEAWNMWLGDDRFETRYVNIDEEKIRSAWRRLIRSEVNISQYANTGGMENVPPRYLHDILPHISIKGFDEIQLSIVSNQRYHLGLGNLYNLVRILGSGSFGSVFGLALRTREIDTRVIGILNSEHGTSRRGLIELDNYLSTLRPVVAVKVSLAGEWKASMREFVIGRQVSNVLYPLGIRAVPAVYALSHVPFERTGLYFRTVEKTRGGYMLRESASKDNVYRVAGTVANKRMPDADELSEMVDDYNVMRDSNTKRELGKQYRMLTEDDILMYQEYVDGVTLRRAVDNNLIGIVELNGVLCYLHGILGYLHSKLDFTHSDLHYGNIMLRRHANPVILPILRANGSASHYVRLPFTPVILDLGMSKTKYTVVPGIVTSYRSSPITDIISLTEPTAYEGDTITRRDVVSYGYVSDILLRYRDIDLESLAVKTFIGPYMIYNSEAVLTHDSVAQYIISTGILNTILVDPPLPGAFQDISLSSYVEGDVADLLVSAEQCKDKYDDLIKRHTDKNTILEQAARAYAEGVIDFHARAKGLLRRS